MADVIFVLTALIVVCLGLVLIDPAQNLVRHLVWRRRWKRDDMGTYRRYLSELERMHRE